MPHPATCTCTPCMLGTDGGQRCAHRDCIARPGHPGEHILPKRYVRTVIAALAADLARVLR